MSGTIIIGGGAIGLSLAYHLAHLGHRDVTLIERNKLTSGTSWHAAGIVGPLRASLNMTRLAMYAVELFPRLEEETGLSTGYRRTGGYWLARYPARMDELHRIAALGRHVGLTPSFVSGVDLARAIPGLDPEGLAGAMQVTEDASVNPVDLCMAYARAAKALGVRIHEDVKVSGIIVEGNTARGVRLDSGEEIVADQVALCAGVWSRKLAEQAGLSLPLQAVAHMYVVTEPLPDLPVPFPVIRDLDRGIYIKGDAGKLVIGGFEPDAKCWDPYSSEGDRPFLEMPEDWDQFTPFMGAALALLPPLAQAGIQHFMNGPESFATDSKPMIGAAPNIDGLFVAAGMNSVGIMSSAGVGRALAHWMTDGHPPMDLWEVDVARVDPRATAPAHLEARMTEAVADVFALHWPYKMPKAGRGLRCSVLHDKWQAAGAVFGLTAGWERGLWYAQNVSERTLPYTIGPQNWQPIADREAQAMASGAALIDLSPFGKFDISGPDALTCLVHLVPSDIDVSLGQAVYTQILNERGGIEADVTIIRRFADQFRVTSGAATRWKDLGLLRRALNGRQATLTDRTEDEAVIGVMGPQSRKMLQSLSKDDWVDFPFSTAREVTVAGQKMLATRISYVGELGWELSIPTASAPPVFDALSAAGATPMGHFALDGCRIEKGFKHWGHDLGPEITPLEAGLGFIIDWNKPDFIGRDALLAQKDGGITQRLVLFQMPLNCLMLHDEPIWEAGRVVGLTTSGARGGRTGLNLCFGMVKSTPGEKLAATCARRFEIEVAGQRYSAIALTQPPYDPKGTRMRA